MALRRTARPKPTDLSAPRLAPCPAASPRLKSSAAGAKGRPALGCVLSQARLWGSRQDGVRPPASSSALAMEVVKQEMKQAEAQIINRKRERDKVQKDLRSKRRQLTMQTTSVDDYRPRASLGLQSLLEISHPKVATRLDYERRLGLF